jgi:hypothetical protein
MQMQGGAGLKAPPFHSAPQQFLISLPESKCGAGLAFQTLRLFNFLGFPGLPKVQRRREGKPDCRAESQVARPGNSPPASAN